MHNTILSLANNNRNADFVKKSFLRIALIGCVVLIPEIIFYIILGNYLLLATCISVALFLGFQIWSILVKKHYYANLTLFLFFPVWLLALVITFMQGDMVSGLSWTFVCIALLYFILPQGRAWIANGLTIVVILPVVLRMLEPLQAMQVTISLVCISTFLAIFIHIITNQQRDLHLLAATDSLTGLFNRNILYKSLDQATEQNNRKAIDMTLITFDIDHFKSINDTYGHDVGDDVLRTLGGLLKERVRRADKAFRVGGEEFIILLFGTNLGEGQTFAEELRMLVADTNFIDDCSVTISVGVSTLLADEDWITWVKRADENLYLAKSAGRNKVIHEHDSQQVELSHPLVNMSI